MHGWSSWDHGLGFLLEPYIYGLQQVGETRALPRGATVLLAKHRRYKVAQYVEVLTPVGNLELFKCQTR
jgi:hypothetical protein